MKKKIVLFLTMILLWGLLNWPPDWEHLLVGLFVALFVTYLTQDLYFQRPHLLKHPRRYFYFVFVFVPLFFWEYLWTGVLLALRVLSPTLAVRPAFVEARTSLKSDISLTFLANAVTLATNAVSVDVDKDKGTLLVHWLDGANAGPEAATDRLVRRFETVLEKIFD
jgi:multicomponent Na+:H+ antiporter subunit E